MGEAAGELPAVTFEDLEVVDDRAEPFLRLEPCDARRAAEALEAYADANRMEVAAGEAEDEWHAAVLLDRAADADALVARFRNWAEHWEPDGNTW